MILEKEYLVKLNAYWPTDALKQRGGFAQYAMKINDSPKPPGEKKDRKRRSAESQPEQDICFINPPKGESLKTEFQIKCEEEKIDENDLPLMYMWTYRKSKNETWKSITYPSDGELDTIVYHIRWMLVTEANSNLFCRFSWILQLISMKMAKSSVLRISHPTEFIF